MNVQSSANGQWIQQSGYKKMVLCVFDFYQVGFYCFFQFTFASQSLPCQADFIIDPLAIRISLKSVFNLLRQPSVLRGYYDWSLGQLYSKHSSLRASLSVYGYAFTPLFLSSTRNSWIGISAISAAFPTLIEPLEKASIAAAILTFLFGQEFWNFNLNHFRQENHTSFLFIS